MGSTGPYEGSTGTGRIRTHGGERRMKSQVQRMVDVSVALLQVVVRVVQWQSSLELAVLPFTLSHNAVEARLQLSNLHIMRLWCVCAVIQYPVRLSPGLSSGVSSSESTSAYSACMAET